MLTNLARRLEILEEQRALEGFDVSPKVLIEIEKIKTEIATIRLGSEETGKKASEVSGNDIPATIEHALELYLEEVGKSRASSTLTTYHYTIQRFKNTLIDHKVPPAQTPLSAMTNEWIHWFLDDLRLLEPTTERGYLAPVIGFYEYVVAKNWLDLNLTEMRYFIKRRQRKLPEKAQRFPKQQVERLLKSLDQIVSGPFKDDREQLAVLRDRALLYLLADTGLRVSEVCSLKRGQIDWNELDLFVVGKGNKEARLRISERAMSRLRVYLDQRQDPAHAPASLVDLPLFARHDKRAGNQLLPLSPRSVQQLIDRWVSRFLGDVYLREITPHTFRHYFVTTILRSTGGDVEVAKKLARHADISTTMRYAHLSDEELDRIYYDIFDAE
ncbi:MAG: tyrosine-type recombinase/integrase [Anaerolineae bacterium]|nr:tyrosine-type recombinase/integrase [Anaerolineae bacterium]